MALGDHPGGFAGACWAFTNADSLRFYRDNDFVAEFAPDRRGRFAALPHPPIEIHDFVGLLLEKYEGLDRAAAPQVAAILNEMRRDAMELSPLSRARMYSLRLSWNELLQLYYKYIGVLGSPSAVYRFEAVWHGRAVRTVVKEPVQSVRLECTVHNPILTDGPTWDCAAVSLRAIDQNGNLLPYCGEAVQLSAAHPRPQRRAPAGRHGRHLSCHHRRGRPGPAALPDGRCAGHRSLPYHPPPGGGEGLNLVSLR